MTPGACRISKLRRCGRAAAARASATRRRPMSSSRRNRASARRIADRIVGKRREPVLAAVDRPGVRGARRASRWCRSCALAMTLAQGSGVSWSPSSATTYSRPPLAEPAEPGRERKRRGWPRLVWPGGRLGRAAAHRERRRAAAPAARPGRSSWACRSPRSLRSTTRATASSSVRVGLGEVVAAEQVGAARPVQSRRATGPGRAATRAAPASRRDRSSDARSG